MQLSIIVVCFRAGNKLIETLDSIRTQSYRDYEVVIKDANSKDGTIEKAKEWLANYPKFAEKINIYLDADKGIYDGMNQAVTKASGDFVYFLNCGDLFTEDTCLATFMKEVATSKNSIYYGDVFDKIREAKVASVPQINSFACFRNVPCHQTCVYSRDLFEKRAYDLQYKVRADYEHFLWSYFTEKASITHIPVALAIYEGGGFSETVENRKRSAAEHKKITKEYIPALPLFGFRCLMILSLQPLRTAIAESKTLGGIYQKIKATLYGRRA